MEDITGPAHAAGSALYEVSSVSAQLGAEIESTREQAIHVYAKLATVAEELKGIKAEITQITDNSAATTTAGKIIESAETASEALTPLALSSQNSRVNAAMEDTAGTTELTTDTAIKISGALLLAQEQSKQIDGIIARLKEVQETGTKAVNTVFDTAAASATAQGTLARGAKDLIDAYLAEIGLPPSPSGPSNP